MSDEHPPIPRAEPGAGDESLARTIRILPSESLLQGDREVRIRHGDQFYRLIETRNGKLLLNKE